MAQPDSGCDDFGMTAQARRGAWLVVCLALLVVCWGGFARIAGAVVSQGVVISETGPRSVEHATGGLIHEVFVQEGQRVAEGQLLARLSPAEITAVAALSDSRVRELEVRRQRLTAERDGVPFSPDSSDPAMQAPVIAERQMLAVRQRLNQERRNQLIQQMLQTRAEIDGLQVQLTAGEAERALIGRELDGMRRLHEQGYAAISRVNALEREAHRLDAQRGTHLAAVAQRRAQIAQLEVQVLQLGSEHKAAVLNELSETQVQLEQARAQNVADANARRHLDLRAPAAGLVQQLAIRTPGAVLAPGERLMLVVPEHDRLIVEVQVAPDKIDRIQTGQMTRIRFPAFAAATTPEFPGRVTRISPTVHTDDRTGAAFYLVACEIEASSHPSVRRLKSGMPAEAHLATGSRSALSYFLKPLLDQVLRTFREP